jgi:SAM-dependent methyltransferase
VASLQDQLAFRRYRKFDDGQWHKVLLQSVDGKSKVPMPGFPAGELQASFVGSSGADAIQEAWNFYALMADRRRRYGAPLDPSSQVLDFGCGWGRFARMFLRDVYPSHIWCVDSWDVALDACRQTGVPGQKIQIEQMPPSPLPDATFDTGFAYSVFSHLSPKAHLAWRDEFVRVMRPGSLVFITTQARWFLDNCREFREDPSKQVSPWHVALAGAFVDYDECAAAYDGGEVLYNPSGGGPALDPEFYGEAIVPRQFFEREWSNGFEILEFITDRTHFEQAVCIMRRR